MAGNQELISVVVPVYNATQTLIQCVESITKQTYKNIEIILVDDGSTDDSYQICKHLESEDDRIRVIQQLNAGLSSARNTGIQHTRGKFISFVDSDDFIDNHMYEVMYAAMMQTKADIAACGRFVINEQGITSHRFCLPNQEVFDDSEALRELLLRKSIDEAVWDKLYRKALFANIEFPIGEINEDLLVTTALLLRCRKIVHVGVPLYSYRFTAGSITKSSYNSSKSIVKEHLQDLQKMIKRFRPELESDVNVLLAEYAVDMLDPLLEKRQNVIEYNEDYRFYERILASYIGVFLFKSGSPKVLKIKSVLMFFRLYGPMKRARQRLLLTMSRRGRK